MNHRILIESLTILADSDPRLFAETIRQYGLEVIGLKNNDPLEKQVQLETIESMASVITESIDENEELHPTILAIKQLAEARGYIVRLIDEAPVIAPPRTKPKPGREVKPDKEPKRSPWNPPKPAKLPKPKARSRDDEGIGEGTFPQPPSPPRKSTHPLPEPVYPGSSKDKARKEVERVERLKSSPEELKAQREKERKKPKNYHYF
jgi:hypothetical protein